MRCRRLPGTLLSGMQIHRKLCAQHADTPALKVLVEEQCSDMDRILSSGHRSLVLLGHWTEHLQGLLMDQVGALWHGQEPNRGHRCDRNAIIKGHLDYKAAGSQAA